MAAYKTRCKLCKVYKIIKPGLVYCDECWRRSAPEKEE